MVRIVIKPRFFGNERRSGGASAELDGFLLEHGVIDMVLGRFAGSRIRSGVERTTSVPSQGRDFDIAFERTTRRRTSDGEGDREIDLTYCFIMDYVRGAILAPEATNYVDSLLATEPSP